MSIIAKKKVQFSRRGGVCIRTLRCARPGAGKMLRDSERGAFKFIFLGQSTVCERAWYNSVLHSKKERIQKWVERRDKLKVQRLERENTKLKKIISNCLD